MPESTPPTASLALEHFQHPEDEASFLNLKAIAWLSKFSQSFVMADVERDLRLLSLADHVLLRRGDRPALHEALDRALAALEFPHRPEVFLECNPVPHSYAFGETQPLLVVTSGLLGLLDEDEQAAVIAHEVGHLKCGHTFYQMVAQSFSSLSQLAGAVPLVGAVSFGARVPLYDWYRKADLSADRAALLAAGEPKVLVRAIAKLAGGFAQAVTEAGLVEQAELFERRCEELRGGSLRDRATYYLSTVFIQNFLRTQPYPAVRVRELLRWAGSEHFNALKRRDFEAALRCRLKEREDPEQQEQESWSVSQLWTDFVGFFGGEEEARAPDRER
ncbi:MAG: M48 family metallopeptidase [Planctomycetota bacterium]|nr:M48 family metallopeptidase [Planctomycetota bacterium]